jgi:hypothetical protein
MTRASRRERWRDALLVVAIGACGLLVRADAFRQEFSADDYAQLSMVEGKYPVPRAPLALFTFSDGSRREVAALAQTGFYPWFVDPHLKLSMLRPLSCALFWADHALFGRWALGYHLHSALWWLGTLGCVFALCAPLLGRAAALIALVFFALDEAQGPALAWIAQRNALVSASFAALAVAAYVRYRKHGARGDAAAACALICAGLLGGEYALCLLGYAAGYELWVARDAAARRARALGLLFVPAVAFVALRSLLGFGAAGSGMYVDPIREAPEFIARAGERFPTLLSDLVFGMRADDWTFGFPWTPQLVARGLLPPESFVDFAVVRYIQESLGWLGLGVAGLLCWLAARLSPERLRVIGMFATGALFATLPLLTALPSGRLLLAAQIGWAAVLGVLVHAAVARLRAKGASTDATPGPAGKLAAAVALVCALPHLTLLPALGLLDLAAGRAYARDMREAIVSADLGARAASQRVLLLQAADHLTPSYFALIRTLFAAPAPPSVWTLSPSPLPVVVQRPAADTLELRYPISGLLHGSLEPPVFRKLSQRPAPGARFVLDGMVAEVLERRGDAITAVRFRFKPDLDAPLWQLLAPTPAGYARVPMPRIGGSLQLGIAPLPKPP